MTNLFQLFQDATSAAPPSGLSVEDVFTAMRSRRQRRLRNAVAATAAVGAAGFCSAAFSAGLLAGAGAEGAQPTRSAAIASVLHARTPERASSLIPCIAVSSPFARCAGLVGGWSPPGTSVTERIRAGESRGKFHS